MKHYPRPDGRDTPRGDSTPIPNRGSSTHVTETYGADLSPDARNRMGSAKSKADHDLHRNMPPGPLK